MRVAALERWLWRGTFEPKAERLPATEVQEATSADLAEAVCRHLKALQTGADRLVAAAERRRAIESRGADTPPSEAEARQIAKNMLPSLDAIDRILEYAEKADRSDEVFQNFLSSVRGLKTRILKTLDGIGLTPIASVGMEVDLDVHDVIATVPAGQHRPNTVVSESQRGYYFRGRLLRDAKVVVAQ